MLTQIKIIKRDHYQYGESYTMQLDFNGKIAVFNIAEGTFDALTEEFGEPIKSGQFKQDIEYSMNINNCQAKD